MVKVGDKVRITSNTYPTQCPRGTVCTVKHDYGNGNIAALVGGGDGFGWYFCNDDYEPIQDTPTETARNELAELAKRQGIVITVSAGALSVTYDGRT